MSVILVIFFQPYLLKNFNLFWQKIQYICICFKQWICVSNLSIFCLTEHLLSVRSVGKISKQGIFKCTLNAGEQWNLCTFWFKTPQQILYPFFTGKIDIPPTRIWNLIRQFLNCWFGIYRIFDSKFTGIRQASCSHLYPE